jgi:hypothetical protein
MELIIGFPVWGVCPDLLQSVSIVGASAVDTLPDDKELPVFHGYEGMPTEWAAKLVGFVESVLFRREQGMADLALVLALSPVVPVDVFSRGTAAGTSGSIGDVAVPAAPDRFDGTAVMGTLVFSQEMIPVLMRDRDDLREGVG